MCDVVKDCADPNYRGKACSKHYRRMQKYGTYDASALSKPGPKPDPTKFRSRHNSDNPNRARPPKPRQEVTQCPQGHSYDDENTYVDGNGYKHCRTCQRTKMAERRGQGPGQGTFNANKTHCPQGHEYTEGNTLRNKEGRRWCRTCQKVSQRRIRLQRYGLTPEQFDELWDEQEGKCAGCKVDLPMTNTKQGNVDHFHDTGQVRGILCTKCNLTIGHSDDDPTRLIALAQYLLASDAFRVKADMTEVEQDACITPEDIIGEPA